MTSPNPPGDSAPFPPARARTSQARGGLVLAALAACAFLLVTGLIAARVVRKYQPPGRFDPARQGFCDFHNGVYFPSLAFARQISPWSDEYARLYPVERPIPLYTPATVLVHWPITWLELWVAEPVWYLLLCLLLLLIAWLALRLAGWSTASWLVLGLAALLAATRSGYGTLFTGYFSLELVLGTLVAVHAGHRTWVGGLGFALAGLKPTTAIPLAILMAARGQWRAVAAGSLMLGLASALVVGWIAMGTGDLNPLHQFQSAQEQHRIDPNEQPRHSWTRVDLLAIVAKWQNVAPGDLEHLLVMVPLIAVPTWLLWRAGQAAVPVNGWFRTGPAESVMLLAVLVSLYHHYYDLLVLAPVVLAAGAGQGAWRQFPAGRRILAWSGGAVCYNYASSSLVLDGLDLPETGYLVVTSINGCLLPVALAVACNCLWRLSRQRPEEPDPARSEDA